MNDSPFPLSDPGRPTDGGRSTHRLVIAGTGPTLALQFEQRNGSAGFQTVVFGLETVPSPQPLPVVISATDMAFGQGWEFRTSGLWTEQVREQGFDHWSYGLEAFALAIDEPDELVRRAHGHRVPLGWELDFVATGPPVAEPIGDPGSFIQPGVVEGLVLTGHGQQEIAGEARRSHWCGPRPAHTDLGDLTHSDQSQPGSVILPTMWGPWTVCPGETGPIAPARR